MKVFISWSGPQSNYIARTLRDWLREVIQNLDPWMSEIDIEAGQRWASELWKGLEDSHFGVVCLTAENLQSEWLHYEAGALAKTVEGRVCPYLYKIDPSAVKGPLSQLQMKQADEQGTKELVQSINTVITSLSEKDLLTNEKILSTEQLNKAFSRCWFELEKALNVVPPSTIASPPPRDIREILEEILEISRSLAREAASAQEIREREAARAKKEKLEIILKSLAERTNSDLIKELDKDRLSIADLVSSLSKKLPPPSDTPQEGKPSSK